MEIILLYWDDLDDLLGALRLLGEAVRRWLIRLFKLLAMVIAAAGIMLTALYEPPLGMAVLTSAFVAAFYRRVTNPRLRPAAA